MMAWSILVIAGLLEVVWAYSLKLSDGLSKPGLAILTIIIAFTSFYLLSISMRSLPLGTAYMAWTGIGAVGAFIVGIMVLGEDASPMRILAASLIVAGLLILKSYSPH